jgi:hypothetical protein
LHTFERVLGCLRLLHLRRECHAAVLGLGRAGTGQPGESNHSSDRLTSIQHEALLLQIEDYVRQKFFMSLVSLILQGLLGEHRLRPGPYGQRQGFGDGQAAEPALWLFANRRLHAVQRRSFLRISSIDLGHVRRNVALPAKKLARHCGDYVNVEKGRVHLVKNWLEQVKVQASEESVDEQTLAPSCARGCMSCAARQVLHRCMDGC